MNELLKRQISLLPSLPGCYLMKDKDDKIIYIGKAKNLKKRVSQYFLRPQSGKVAAMVSHVDHFDTLIVHSEKEAFILEMNLIQTHYPRYNIMLMDDSHYPYIALKRGGDLYLKIARNTKDPSYYYFGPFPSSYSAYQSIDLLNKIYPLRKCRNLPKKSCLYYSLGQCLAPCVNKIDPEVYSSLYEAIKRFLNGDTAKEEAELKEKMKLASDLLDYERAGEIKKSLDAIKEVTSKQAVEILGEKTSRDVFAYAEREGYRSLAILTYRRGLLLGKNIHVVPSFEDAESQISDLIAEYYLNHETPKEVVSRLPSLEENLSPLYEDISVVYPQKGRLLDLVNLAELNARQGLDAHFLSARLEDDNLALLEELGTLLNIKTPYRIELFDNSHLQGSFPVGALVCYINGEPAKKMYRKFHLDEKDAGDDFHSMEEVVRRRYQRLKDENSELPDLILTDGGKIQVDAALASLKEVGVSIPVAGLYKNEKHETEGLIDQNGEVHPIKRSSPLFFLLMRMQDEVHRFAISFHKSLRNKAMSESILDNIPSLGPKRKESLQAHYRSLEALKAASLEELEQILPPETAKALYNKLRKN